MFNRFGAWIEQYQRFFGLPLVFVMAISALAIALLQPRFLEQIEMKTLDQRFLIRGPLQPDKRVVILAVDDNALTEVGRWPWSRDKIATLLDRVLGEYGARALGFDIVFSEKQDNPLKETLRLLEKNAHIDVGVSEWLRTHQSVGDVDSLLTRTFAKYHDKLVPGYFFYSSPKGTPALAVERLSAIKQQLENSAITAKVSERAEMLVPRMSAVESNLPQMTKAVDATGFFNFFPDHDGMVRRVPLLAELDGFIYPSMALQTLRVFLGWPELTALIDIGGVRGVRIGNVEIPTDPSGGMLLNHYGAAKTFTHVSAADVLAGRVNPDVFRGAVVLFGVTAVGVYDYRPSPFDSALPGIEGHATAVANILNQSEIKRPASLEMAEIVAVLLLSLLTGWMVNHRGPLVQSIGIFGVPVLILLTAYWLFVSFGLWLKVTYLLLGGLMAMLPTTLLDYFIEARKRAFIHDAFSHYLAPEIVDSLSAHPESLKLGGEQKMITAFFSDIAGFSSFSERLTPEELVTLLNRYLTAMSDVILRHGGTIDKYEGDAIIAFFGAPLDQPDHARLCVMAAMEQQALLSVLREQWIKEGLPKVSVRMGINTGLAVVGNMGTEKHMNYTMMGDDVNLASRLEGVNKVYRTPLLISRETYALVREDIAARFVDRVRVVGRHEPVNLYEPLGPRETVDEALMLRSRRYEKAWQMMQNHHFSEAAKMLTSLVAEFPDDGVYEVMLGRVRGYLKTPPPLDWEGVFELASK